jgi:hypothetical protein
VIVADEPVAVLGDSQGVGALPEIARELNVVHSNPQVGWTTRRTFNEALPAALASSATTIIVITGGNDEPGPGSRAVTDLVRAVRAAGKRAIIVGPVFAIHQPEAGAHDIVRGPLLAAARAAGAKAIDAYPLTRDLARASNVHLTTANYTIYGRRIVSAMKSSGWGGTILGIGLALLAWRMTR